MRIIGKTDNGYILEASQDDVAAMEGMYPHEKRFNIGDNVDMAGLFRKYSSVNMAFNDLDRLRKSAQGIIDATKWVDEFRSK